MQGAGWGYDYPFDILGAWDYAVHDPDGALGCAMKQLALTLGANTPDQLYTTYSKDLKILIVTAQITFLTRNCSQRSFLSEE